VNKLVVAMAVVVLGSVAARAEEDHAEEARRAAAAAEPEALKDRAKTARSASARRVTDHFNVITLHANNPPPARLKNGAHLRDVFGTALYDGAKDQLVTCHGDEPMVVQQRPIVRDRRGNRMFYLRGTVGEYRVGGQPTKNRYSGFVWSSAIVEEDRKRLPEGFEHINVVAGSWREAIDRHSIGQRVIAPVPVIGTHVGKIGTANHVLRMYGHAHGNHEDFVFGCTNLLGHVAGGGQVDVILPRGSTVEATDIVHTVPDTRKGPDLHFRLCTVRIGPPGDTVEVATWIAVQCLARPEAPAPAPGGQLSLLGLGSMLGVGK
jgi:hypothetical protein